MRLAAAVVGSPIAHSLSPALHRAAYRSLGLEGWTYDAIEVSAGGLAARCEQLRQSGIDGLPVAGLSVTMPLKHEAMALATEVDPRAAPLGAANTLIGLDSGWRAHNTDVDGILGAAAELGLARIDGERCVVLGAGGTSVAVLAALHHLGADGADLVVRDRARAQRTVDVANAIGLPVTVRAWTAGADLVADADVVVSTVPKGAADHLSETAWKSGAVLIDAVYNDGPTPVVLAARQHGVRAAGGVLMLLHQAVRQVELMTGLRPDIEPMRAALPH